MYSTEKIVFDYLNKKNLAFCSSTPMRKYKIETINSLVKLCTKQYKKPILLYEVPLNDTLKKYPDFYLSDGNYSMRIEIKNSCNEQSIAKEANSLFDFTDNEYLYILMNGQNINKIYEYTNNLDDRIQFMHFDKNLIKEMIKKRF